MKILTFHEKYENILQDTTEINITPCSMNNKYMYTSIYFGFKKRKKKKKAYILWDPTFVDACPLSVTLSSSTSVNVASTKLASNERSLVMDKVTGLEKLNCTV